MRVPRTRTSKLPSNTYPAPNFLQRVPTKGETTAKASRGMVVSIPVLLLLYDAGHGAYAGERPAQTAGKKYDADGKQGQISSV